MTPPRSSTAARGFTGFTADADPAQGADHVSVKRSRDQGSIALTDSAGGLSDTIFYGPQRTDVAQGRTPSGADSINDLLQPTPGAPNPGFAANVSINTLTLITMTNLWRYHSLGQDLGTSWRNPGLDDPVWTNSRGLFYAT